MSGFWSAELFVDTDAGPQAVGAVGPADDAAQAEEKAREWIGRTVSDFASDTSTRIVYQYPDAGTEIVQAAVTAFTDNGVTIPGTTLYIR